MPKLSTLTKVRSKCSVSSISSVRKSTYKDSSRTSARGSRINSNIKGYLDSKDKRDSGFLAASQQNIHQFRKTDMRNPDESFVGVVSTISNPYSRMSGARGSIVSSNLSEMSQAKSDLFRRRHSSYDKNSSLSSRSRRSSSFSAKKYDIHNSDSQALQVPNTTKQHEKSHARGNNSSYV